MEKYEWDPAPPTARQRIIAAICLVPALVSAASYCADWRLFGDYDKQVMGLCILVLGICIYWLPGVRRS